MSLPRRNKHQMPSNAQLYCPQYLEFDARARKESKDRFTEHVTGRRQLLKQCIDPVMYNIYTLLQFLKLILFNQHRYIHYRQLQRLEVLY